MLKILLTRTCLAALLAGLPAVALAQEKPEGTRKPEETRAVKVREAFKEDFEKDQQTVQQKLEAARERAAQAEAAAARARDEAIQLEQSLLRQKLAGNRERLSLGKFWIGVGCAPVPPAVAAQLGLAEGQGLIVEDVVPDSPAAKAGIARNDLLTVVGDTKVNSLQDLVDAVQKADGKELTVKYLRGGKEAEARIVPAERPSDQRYAAEGNEGLEVILEDGPQGAVRVIRPGVVFNRELPKEFSITISRKENEKTRIAATVDGKSYEATEDQLETLPPSIREQVRAVVHGPRYGGVARMRGMAMPGMPGFPGQPVPASPARQANPDGSEKRLDDIEKKLDALQQALDRLNKRDNK